MDIKKTGNKVTLTFDIASLKDAPQSASGKTKVAYSTRGFTWSEGLGISMNVIYSNK